MVALLSFTLPIRPDVDRLNNELKAQTVVTKFRTQHNAFKKYIESKKVPLAEQTGGGAPKVVYYSGLGYKGGQMLPSQVSGANIPTKTGFRNEVGMNKSFDPEKEAKIMKNYLPFGFDKETSNIYSKVFCFASMPGQLYNYTHACEQNEEFRFSYEDKADCCARSDVDVYVISWQPMPSRWLQPDPEFKNMNKKVSQPISDMMAVISKADGYGYSFGYVTYLKELGDKKNGGTMQLKVDVSKRVMSGGSYRTLKAQADEEGNLTGAYKEDLGYRPIFNILLDDPDFAYNCATKTEIKNPCLIAMNKVSNREEE